MIPECLSCGSVVGEVLDSVEAPVDFLGIRQGGREPCSQRPGARTGPSAINGGEEAARPLSIQGLCELQVPPRSLIDLHDSAIRQAPGRGQARQFALLGEFDIINECATGRNFSS